MYVGKRSLGSDSESSQSLLQHSYFIAAAAIVFALIILRIVLLRRRNQTLSDFFRIGSRSQYSPPPDEINYRSMYHGIQLTPLPAAYRPDRRIHAADTDAHGRRLDATGESWNGKDALPAYDNFDRPPKYVEAGWKHGGSPLPTAQSMVTPTPEGEQSGLAHLNTAHGPLGDDVGQPLYHTHSMAGVTHGAEEIPPPPHHDLPSS